MTSPDDRDQTDAAMRDRLAALSKDLGGTRPAADTPSRTQASASGVGEAMSLGFRVMSEFVAAVVVGGFLGWMIDRGLGTSPIALIIFIGFGTAAGFWSVYRVATTPRSK